jgi:hypothetical protein
MTGFEVVAPRCLSLFEACFSAIKIAETFHAFVMSIEGYVQTSMMAKPSMLILINISQNRVLAVSADASLRLDALIESTQGH